MRKGGKKIRKDRRGHFKLRGKGWLRLQGKREGAKERESKGSRVGHIKVGSCLNQCQACVCLTESRQEVSEAVVGVHGGRRQL